jgi:hypothetical protein
LKKNTNGETTKPSIPVLTVQDAIKAGHITRERATVTLPKGYKTRANTRLEHDITESYMRLKANDVVGMLALAEGDLDQVLKLFNTQYDIKLQLPVKYRMQKTASRPKAAANKAVMSLRAAAKALVDSGQAKSTKEALKMLLEEAESDKK